MVKRKSRKKPVPAWKNIYYIMAGLIVVAMVTLFLSPTLLPQTTVWNHPKEMVFDAQIKLVVDDDTFEWNMYESFPTSLKQKALNGTLEIFILIDEDTNVDIVDVILRVEGPVPGEYEFSETETGDWIYNYDSTVLTNGTYIFTIEGSVDTSPLDREGVGEIIDVEYAAFNIIWDGTGGHVNEIFGLPQEIVIIGVIVVGALAVTGAKKKQSQQIIMMPQGGYNGS